MTLQEAKIFTESDVEQKFIYNLLTELPPLGLGYNDSDFRTKLDIRKLKIDKGKKEHLYFPDYIIVIDGLPMLIIEAKAPNENLDEAIREARLYAIELNSQFPQNINPCSKLIVTNGNTTIATTWDSDVQQIMFNFEDVNITNVNFDKFIKFAAKNVLSQDSQQIRRNIRLDSRFVKPVHLLGGKTVQNESVGENSFGANISLEYKYLFNPQNIEERSLIVKNAYVGSKKKLFQVGQIDRIIRSAISPIQKEGIQILDTENPKEIIELLSDKKKLKNEVCLLIGSVGSGKSTFTDYIREVALPIELKQETFWLNLNLNNSPGDKDLIYTWIIDELILGIKEGFPDVDFDDIEIIKILFSAQIKALKKGPISLLGENSEKYKEILVNKLLELQNDNIELLKAMIKYLFIDRNKLFIVVLDNCDKRDRATQLLMFEVANWLKTSFTCMVLLPLRDSTFDNYRKEPPLDTVIKDLVFRIDPPLLDRVIYERFNYAIREIGHDNRDFYYYTSNNIRVQCKREDVKFYLQCILTSLFQNNFFKRLITGLAGRDTRKGLEIFLDFCKSGHITEDEILKIRAAKGVHILPNHIISRIFLRGTRRFYSDENSIIKNLFCSYPNDDIPDPYVRQEILVWLKNRYSVHGPNRTKGFHRTIDLIRDLQAMGHSEHRILEEIEKLAIASCIISESQMNNINKEDLICIAPSGFVHLELLNNLDYLASISEDSLFRNLQSAETIAHNLTGKSIHTHMSKTASIENAQKLIDYLIDYKNYFLSKPDLFLESDKIENLSLLDNSKVYLDSLWESNDSILEIEKLMQDFPIGSSHNAQIVSIQRYGLFVEFGLNGTGLIHISNTLTPDSPLLEDYEIGDWIKVEILEFNKSHNRFHLKMIED